MIVAYELLETAAQQRKNAIYSLNLQSQIDFELEYSLKKFSLEVVDTSLSR